MFLNTCNLNTETILMWLLQNPYAPESDPCLVVESYTRSFEQNDTLGLNDMKTENYT